MKLLGKPRRMPSMTSGYGLEVTGFVAAESSSPETLHAGR
jgi:hypothetical protein